MCSLRPQAGPSLLVQEVCDFLRNLGFQQCQADKCVYFADFEEKKVILAFYVDDGLILAEDDKTLSKVINELKHVFEVTVGDPGYYLGMEISKDPSDGSIFIHGTSYIDRLLKRFNLQDACTISTPADPHVVLVRPAKETDANSENNVPYREAIGSLIFAAVTTRPDIMFAVSVLSRFLTNFNNSHWNAAKRVFKYLKATRTHGIKYVRNDKNETLIGYSDADYANDPDTRRSMNGYVFLMSAGPVTWCCQCQKSVALSTTEAEYVAASNASREVLWLRQLISEIDEISDSGTVLCVDNQSAIKLIKNPVFHRRSKHIDVVYHFIR